MYSHAGQPVRTRAMSDHDVDDLVVEAFQAVARCGAEAGERPFVLGQDRDPMPLANREQAVVQHHDTVAEGLPSVCLHMGTDVVIAVAVCAQLEACHHTVLEVAESVERHARRARRWRHARSLDSNAEPGLLERDICGRGTPRTHCCGDRVFPSVVDVRRDRARRLSTSADGCNSRKPADLDSPRVHSAFVCH